LFEDAELTEAQRAYLRQQRMQRRRIMEKERRKAIRAARQRLKEARIRARLAVGILMCDRMLMNAQFN
jgi:hypothetical protein